MGPKTPARKTPAGRKSTTRAFSATPLPPLHAHENHSYGTAGNPELPDQVFDANIDIDAAMGGPALSPAKHSPSKRASKVPTERESEDVVTDLAPRTTRAKSARHGSEALSEGLPSKPARKTRSSVAPTGPEEDRTFTFLGNLPGEMQVLIPSSGLTVDSGQGAQAKDAAKKKAGSKASQAKAAMDSAYEEDQEEEDEDVGDEVQVASAAQRLRRSVSAKASSVRKSLTSSISSAGKTSQTSKSRSSNHHKSETGPTDAEDHEPNPVAVFFRTLPRYLPQVIRDAGSNGVLGWLKLFFITGLISTLLLSALYAGASLLPLPEFLQGRAESLVTSYKRAFQVSPFDLPPAELEYQWGLFKHNLYFDKELPEYNLPEMQWAINRQVQSRLDKVESQIKDLQSTVGLHNSTMTMLNKVLPNTIAVRVVDNQWEIPEHFWKALQQKLTTDERSITPLWENFMAQNEQKIELMSRHVISEEVKKAISKQHLITRDMFLEAVEENYGMLQDKYGDDLRKVEKKLLTEAQKVSVRTTHDLIEKSPIARFAKLQSDSLAYSNVIANTKAALMQVNHFAVGLGARINPTLTSPTFRKNTGIIKRIYVWVMNEAVPLAPIAALQSWEEATECWCATPTKDKSMGKAQLAVETGEKIFADRIIVEHVPHTATLNINAAPRNMELWVETESTERAVQIQKVIDETIPPSEYRDCSSAPTSRHVCVSKFRYDIHYDNWVQSHGMFVDTETMSLDSNKFVVKAVTNWGSNEATCLYRIRLTGKRVFVPYPPKL